MVVQEGGMSCIHEIGGLDLVGPDVVLVSRFFFFGEAHLQYRRLLTAEKMNVEERCSSWFPHQG